MLDIGERLAPSELLDHAWIIEDTKVWAGIRVSFRERLDHAWSEDGKISMLTDFRHSQCKSSIDLWISGSESGSGWFGYQSKSWCKLTCVTAVVSSVVINDLPICV